jgi:myo-inositol-1(or 4)-monophosphatase
MTRYAELLGVGVEIARAAGRLLADGRPAGRLDVEAKSSPTDVVTAMDRAAEALIADELARLRPEDGVIGEEGADRVGTSGVHWVVDPLDGTVNFLFGIPLFAVSVACEASADAGVGKALAGVVLDPVRGERFTATRSGAAMLDGHPIHGSTRSDLASAMVATGFGYDPAVRERQAAVVARVLPRARDIRRAGAAALDLAWCACGRFDAFYERGLRGWDVAAGALIASRAGLDVRELPATAEDAAGVIVGPGPVVEELLELVGG